MCAAAGEAIRSHPSCLPLDEIDFSSFSNVDLSQFGNECEGMCGV